MNPTPSTIPDPMTLREVADMSRRTTEAVRQWIAVGVWIEGVRVRLAGERIGGRWFVSRAAWEAFRAGCNPHPVPMPGNTAADQRRWQRETEELLAELGPSRPRVNRRES